MSSVASGRQQNRSGAYGGGTQASRNVQPGWLRGAALDAVAVQPAGPGPVDPAVGDQRAETGQADLAAVSMPGEQQVIAVSGKPVQYCGLWRVQHAKPQVRARIGGSGDLVVAVTVDMRVVYAPYLDVEVPGLDPAAPRCWRPASRRRPGPRRAQPTAGPGYGAGAPGRWSATDSASGSSAAGRRDQLEPKTKTPGRSSSGPSASSSGRTAARWGDRVAGVDHEVGLKGVQRAEPGQQPVPSRCQVRVGDMQNPQRTRAFGEHRNVVAPQREPVALDDRRIGGDGGCGQGGAPGRGLVIASTHGAMPAPVANPGPVVGLSRRDRAQRGRMGACLN